LVSFCGCDSTLFSTIFFDLYSTTVGLSNGFDRLCQTHRIEPTLRATDLEEPLEVPNRSRTMYGTELRGFSNGRETEIAQQEKNEKKMPVETRRVSQKFEAYLAESTVSTKPDSTRTYRVPTDLPIFRSKDPREDPEQFLGNFTACCVADGIPQHIWPRIFLKALLPTERGWLLEIPHEPDWKTIEAAFMDHYQSRNRVDTLLGELTTWRQGDLSIQKYGDHFIYLVRRLNQKTTDPFVTALFRKGLRPEFRSLLASHTAIHLNKTAIDLEEIYEVCLSYEAQIRTDQETAKEFLTQNTDNGRYERTKNSSDYAKNNFRCTYCEKDGHTEAYCMKKEHDDKKRSHDNATQQRSDSKPNSPSKRLCYVCDQPGHLKNDCPLKEEATKLAASYKKELERKHR